MRQHLQRLRQPWPCDVPPFAMPAFLKIFSVSSPSTFDAAAFHSSFPRASSSRPRCLFRRSLFFQNDFDPLGRLLDFGAMWSPHLLSSVSLTSSSVLCRVFASRDRAERFQRSGVHRFVFTKCHRRACPWFHRGRRIASRHHLLAGLRVRGLPSCRPRLDLFECFARLDCFSNIGPRRVVRRVRLHVFPHVGQALLASWPDHNLSTVDKVLPQRFSSSIAVDETT